MSQCTLQVILSTHRFCPVVIQWLNWLILYFPFITKNFSLSFLFLKSCLSKMSYLKSLRMGRL